MTEAEESVYGTSTSEIDKHFDWMIRSMGREMTTISVLSDAQEVMAQGDVERARKFINIAKYILSQAAKFNRAA
jgi:hypothetical protein